MGAPLLSTSTINVRSQSVNDLEKTLVAFINQLFFDTYRLDNPGLNLVQPDQVPFDPTQRAQTLVAKVPPQVVRGRVPRTVAGEIDPNALPNFPAIIVQAISAHIAIMETQVTVRIYANAYDEDPESQGYQDCINMIEVIAQALTTFGQGAIDESYPIVMPIDWKLIEENLHPHYVAEMTTLWQLPSGRPTPDFNEEDYPAEHLDFEVEAIVNA